MGVEEIEKSVWIIKSTVAKRFKDLIIENDFLDFQEIEEVIDLLSV